MFQKKSQYGGVTLFLAFALGVAAGGVVLLLTAPTSGAEMRKKLGGLRAKDLADRLPAVLDEARSVGKEALAAVMDRTH